MVADGLVALTKLSLNGRQVLLELRGAGELIGELNAIDGGQRSATARVIEAGVVWVLGRLPSSCSSPAPTGTWRPLCW